MEITTARLKLVPMTEQHWQLFYNLHTDLKVTSLCFDPPSIEEIQAKFQARLNHWTKDVSSWLCLVVINKANNLPVGITGFLYEDDIAQVGYLFLPQYYGNQYATESLNALLKWAISEHSIHQFKAVVTEGNAASKRVLVKCGFKLINIVPEAFEINGKNYSDFVYQYNSSP